MTVTRVMEDHGGFGVTFVAISLLEINIGLEECFGDRVGRQYRLGLRHWLTHG